MSSRDLHYALLEKTGEEGVVEGVEERDSSLERHVEADEYINIAGIPRPPAFVSLGSLVAFAMALLSMAMCLGSLYTNTGVYDTIPLEGLDRISLNISGCDVEFRHAKDDEKPGLHYRTWSFMGFAHAKASSDSIELTLHNQHRVPLFHCNAVFRLRRGMEIAGEMTVSQRGDRVAFSTVDEQGPVRVVLGRRARLDLEDAQVRLDGLDAPEVSINIGHGSVELNRPEVGELKVTSFEAPVAVFSPSRRVEVTMPEQAAKHAAIYAGDIEHPRGAAEGGALEAKLSPAAATDSQRLRALADAGAGAISAHLDASYAPVTVVCGDRGQRLKEYRGGDARQPKLLRAEADIAKIRSFVTSSGSTPFVATVRVTGPGLPKGVWQIMSTKAYLAVSVDSLVLLSAGALSPRLLLAELHLVGLGLNASVMDVFAVLEKEIPDIVEEFDVAWVPSEVEKPVRDSHAVSSMVRNPLGSLNAVVIRKSGTKYQPRHIHTSDVVVFFAALALNLTGAAAVALYLGYFMKNTLIPYILAKQAEGIVDEAASHRMCFMGSQSGWHLRSDIVHYNRRAQRAQTGILLRWKRRDGDFIKSFKIRCHAVSRAHKFTVSFLRHKIVATKDNEALLECFIPLEGMSGGDGHRREAFEIWSSYKFQVVSVGKRGREIEQSMWSSMVQIVPPSPFTDLPFMLLKTFAGLMEDSLSSLNVFCKSSVSHTTIRSTFMLHDIYLDLDHFSLDRIQAISDDGMDVCLSLEWDGGEEMDSEVIPMDGALPFERHGHLFRSTIPISLTGTKSSAEEETLIVKLGSAQGDSVFRMIIKFEELHLQWEQQYHYYDDIESERAMFCGATFCESAHKGGIGPNSSWWGQVGEDYKADTFRKEQGGCKMNCWVAFGADDPHGRTNSVVKWLQCPQTPYDRPTESSAGPPASISQSWQRAGIRGIFPNEVVLQGTQKVLDFSEELTIGGEPVQFVSLELRPAYRNSTRSFHRHVTREPTPVARGRFLWDVRFSDLGDLDGRFVLVAHVDGVKYAPASVEFIITRPLLLSEFEIAYASFCRFHELPMQTLDKNLLEDHGCKVATLPVGVCEGLRPVLPCERYSRARKKLQFCMLEGSMVASRRPITLEGQSQVYRASLRMVPILEGTFWKKPNETWRNDLLLYYNFDHSWLLANKIGVQGLQPILHFFETVLLYVLQIWCFLTPPVAAFGILILHQSLRSRFVFEYDSVTPTTRFLTDWLFSPTQMETLHEQSFITQLMILLIGCYGIFVLFTLTYLNFFRVRNRAFDNTVTSVASLGIGCVSWGFMVFVTMSIMWVVLAALINPVNIMPFAVMIGSILGAGRKLSGGLLSMQEKVNERVNLLLESLLGAMLDEYINSQSDLATMYSKELHVDDMDPGKAKFVRYLCDLGEEVRLPRATSFDSDQGVVEDEHDLMHEEDDHGEQEEAGRGTAGLSPVIRRKLKVCFLHIIAHMPLPPGVQQSLMDPRQLARACIDRRNAMLQELTGDDGKGILKDILERNLDTQMSESLVKILSKDEASQIDVMDSHALTKDATLFYDKELAEQILSMVHARLSKYLKELKSTGKQFFDDLRPTAGTDAGPARVLRREAVLNNLAKYEKAFQDLLKKHGMKAEHFVYKVDATGDGVGNFNLLPVLQALELLPPLDAAGYGGASYLEMVLDYVGEEAKHVTNGRMTVLQRHQVLQLVLQMVDKVGDGRVDQMWWACFKMVCQDIYILAKDPKDNAKFPCALEDLQRAFMQETAKQSTNSPLLPLERVEDVILGKLMTRNGSKKLWREAFVLLSRNLHVWPEIPLDDTIVEVETRSKGSRCEVLNIVNSVMEPQRNADLKCVTQTMKSFPPNPPKAGETPVYKDEQDLVFGDMGDFSPEKGFAFLHHDRKDLKLPATEKWASFGWDKDAALKAHEPPYPGPLAVFLVFLQVDPDGNQVVRPWLQADGWTSVEGRRLPFVEKRAQQGDDSPRRSVTGLMPAYGDHFPVDRLRATAGAAPHAEVWTKTFYRENGAAVLMGMNAASHGDSLADPVLVFFQSQRLNLPDAQSFDDAHEAFFAKSNIFNALWGMYDKSEALRAAQQEDLSRETTNLSTGVLNTSRTTGSLSARTSGSLSARDADGGIGHSMQAVLESTSGTNLIDLTPDGPDLIRTMLLKRHAHEKAPRPCVKNPNILEAQPERLQFGLTAAERRTGKKKNVWLVPLEQDFYIEDMEFVEFDVAESTRFRFKATAVRRKDHPGALDTKVASIGLLRHGMLLPCEHKQVDGAIEFVFKAKTAVDQISFKTLGTDMDPRRWTISAWDEETKRFHQVGERVTDYPLDPKSELVEVGKKQSGAIWHHEGNEWLAIRGIWFDAFHELLAALGMRIDRDTAWSLWRVMLSFKHEPIVPQRPPGFISVAQARSALMGLMEQEPFLSDDMFSWWNSLSQLALPDACKHKLYSKICAQTPDFHGAPNLVRWVDLSRRLKSRVLKSKPYLNRRGVGARSTAPTKQYVVGTLWFEVLYDIVITSMPERYSRDEVREHYMTYANPSTGLLPVDRVYDVIAKLGRPGVKFDEFARFVKNLGMQVDTPTLRVAFNRVDIDQTFTLDLEDVELGITLLLRTVFPKLVLQKIGLSTEQIVRHAAFWLSVLAVIFFFLIMSFMSLVSSRGSPVASSLQSVMAAVSGLGVTLEGSRDMPSEETDSLVDGALESSLGTSARQASRRNGGAAE